MQRLTLVSLFAFAACQVVAPDPREQQKSPSPAPAATPPPSDTKDQEEAPGSEQPEEEEKKEETPVPQALTKRGKVLSTKLVKQYTKATLQSMLADDGFDLPITHGANVYTIDYETQAPRGKTVRARTLALIPSGSTQNLPLLAYNHGTTGLADGCEPSAYPGYEQTFLSYAARGVAVSATDYQGLGTPGPHYYLMNEPTAFSVWDGVRATTAFAKQQGLTLSNEVALIGHSQGGGAALFAHQFHATYAAEYSLLGVVALAPAPIWRSALKTAGESNPYLALFVMYAYSVSLFNPALKFADIASAQMVKDFPGWAADQCVGDLFDSVGDDPSAVLNPTFVAAAKSGDLTSLAAWLTQMDYDSPGNYTSDAPVLLVQGDVDDIVQPAFTDDLHARLCKNGVNATIERIAGDHDAALNAVDVYGPWLLERLYGYDVPPGCP
ncbi:MAG: alpha/beta fold hydrolase [Deltaproteobacteria bacterium]|nr:alpha/beta fold hydrolase [Deltaproteobacteria bacterium]